MCKVRKPARLRPRARSFQDCLRDCLTPAVWKQGHAAFGSQRKFQRWSLHAVVVVSLTMTWCCGDSQSECFEAARGFAIVCRSKRRRPGYTVQGWRKALNRMPAAVWRALAAGVRQRLTPWLQTHGRSAGFIPIGCDGSRLECPRTEELEARLGRAGKTSSAPMLWVTALVHLRTGLLWSWRLGKGTASERGHLRQLLHTLPAGALVVADAGYVGYDLAQTLVAAKVQFLIRMSCQATLYTLRQQSADRLHDDRVYYWPEKAQNQQRPPLPVRLIRVHSRKKKTDVWLLTNVFDSKRLSAAQASQFYRWRWEIEGFFRTYKRTLAMVKLRSRTVRLVHREAESALLAAQLLLAQGAQAMATVRTTAEQAVASPRKILLEIRAEIATAPRRRRRGSYTERLAHAQRERRPRRSSKVKREWPRRGPHKPPKPPNILTPTEGQKARILRQIREQS
jgi:hypothetical protein